ncbi:MAG: MIP family channel protein [Pirellulaceae bacterium]|nr:MIP family channel protein [Pirellulaceae bacterium]MDP7014640.1 MIP family channel protein [Pirellulaceae bacterium]
MLAKQTGREVAAEFLGTAVLMLFGLGVNAQVTTGQLVLLDASGPGVKQFGDWLSINFGWGLAVALAVYTAGGVSGAHLNPAVSVAMAVHGRLAWSKLAPYIVAQMLGAIVASGLVYVVYREAIDAYEITQAQASGEDDQVLESPPRTMSTAGVFATYPRQFQTGDRLSNLGGLVDQMVATAMLLLCVFALSDENNMAPKSNMAPLMVGGVVFMIGMALGSNCGYAINPARDLGPRLFTFFGGWGSQVFQQPNSTWWLVPVAGPCLGGVVGGFVYLLLIAKRHPESPA